MPSEQDLRQRLRTALVTAVKARDTVAVPALRSALSAIDNAEAVTPDAAATRGLAIEQGPVAVGVGVGVGAAAAPRRWMDGWGMLPRGDSGQCAVFVA